MVVSQFLLKMGYWLEFTYSKTLFHEVNTCSKNSIMISNSLTSKPKPHDFFQEIPLWFWWLRKHTGWENFWQSKHSIFKIKLTSRKPVCCSLITFSGICISPLSWSTSMACRWLKVPLPTSCPHIRTWLPGNKYIIAIGISKSYIRFIFERLCINAMSSI